MLALRKGENKTLSYFLHSSSDSDNIMYRIPKKKYSIIVIFVKAGAVKAMIYLKGKIIFAIFSTSIIRAV